MSVCTLHAWFTYLIGILCICSPGYTNNMSSNSQSKIVRAKSHNPSIWPSAPALNPSSLHAPTPNLPMKFNSSGCFQKTPSHSRSHSRFARNRTHGWCDLRVRINSSKDLKEALCFYLLTRIANSFVWFSSQKIYLKAFTVSLSVFCHLQWFYQKKFVYFLLLNIYCVS